MRSAGKPQVRGASPGGKRAVTPPISGLAAEKTTHLGPTPPSSHRRANSPKRTAGKVTPSNEAIATSGKRPTSGKTHLALASPIGGKKKDGFDAADGAAGVPSVSIAHPHHHHPLSNAASVDQIVFHADLDHSSHIHDPRDFHGAAGNASAQSAAAPPGELSAHERLGFADIPHAKFAVPGRDPVPNAQRPAQAGNLIYGREPKPQGPLQGVPQGRPHVFGASTDMADAKYHRQMNPTKGRPHEATRLDGAGVPSSQIAPPSGVGKAAADLACGAGMRTSEAAAHASGKGYQHGSGASYAGAGANSLQSAVGQPGQPQWEVGQEVGVRSAANILSGHYDSDDASEWAGNPSMTFSAGCPGQAKWFVGNGHSGGDFVGVRPISDISNVVVQSDAEQLSAGGEASAEIKPRGDLVSADSIYGIYGPW